MNANFAFFELKDVHEAQEAVVGSEADLLNDNRKLYSFAAELVSPDAELTDSQLDHPKVRFVLAEALAAGERVPPARLAEAAAQLRWKYVVGEVEVVVDPLVNSVLAEFLHAVHPKLRVLTTAKHDRLVAALRVVEEGVVLALTVAPGLVRDLLAHVKVVLIGDGDTAPGVVSATLRRWPGLMMFREPSSAAEVAEALVHEGAHLKFFDMGAVRDLLRVSGDAVEFAPTWRSARWPMEQAMAAWHAYTCLAMFAADFHGSASPSSLLPAAAGRATEIWEWLLERQEHLGDAGHRLLYALSGVAPRPRHEADDIAPQNGSVVAQPDLRFSRRPRIGRELVARFGPPIELFWLEADAAHLLHALREPGVENDLHEIIAMLAPTWGPLTGTRVAVATRALLDASLIRFTPTNP